MMAGFILARLGVCGVSLPQADGSAMWRLTLLWSKPHLFGRGGSLYRFSCTLSRPLLKLQGHKSLIYFCLYLFSFLCIVMCLLSVYVRHHEP